MNKILLVIFFFSLGLTSFAQVGRNVELRIIQAEDARRFDGELEALLRDRSPAVRRRAALAAGRIGDERAVDQLAALLADGDEEVRVMAAFALGEVESVKAADAVLAALKDAATPDAVRARLIEAAGKIVAANAGPPNTPRDQKVIALGDAVLDALEAEAAKGKDQSVEIVRLGLTAALRARAEGSDTVTSLFLTNL
ncbi:MAG: HEAT repeat domain-containing protein, partial [Acidobacteria bacterium]|nr:HEAT repeat domain-containing protein [Acidobacteriota bacterium]